MLKTVYCFLVVLVLAALGVLAWRINQADKLPVVKKDDKAKAMREKMEPDDFWPEAVRPEVGTEVNLSFKAFDYDLTSRYFSDKDLAKMKKADEEFSERMDRHTEFFKNRSRDVSILDKKFTLVSCSGRYSINPMAFGRPRYIYETLQLPSGQWIKGLPGFMTTMYEDGKIFLLTYRRIAQLVDEKTLRVVVSADDGTGLFRTIHWKGAYLGHRYIEVCREGKDSYFGGLLEAKEGKWIFHPYHKGQNRHWLQEATYSHDRPGKIVLMFNEHKHGVAPKKTEFDTVKGTFTDQ